MGKSDYLTRYITSVKEPILHLKQCGYKMENGSNHIFLVPFYSHGIK